MTKDGFDLAGRLAVITGGAGILGARLTLALVAHGAQVAVIDRNPRALADVASASPGAAQGFEADISSRDGLEAAHDAIAQAFGRPVDVLINNAATKSAHFFEPFEDYRLEDWDEVMRVNLTSAMMACQIFGGAMAKRGRGSIINTISIYGIVAPDMRIYEGSLYEGRAINSPAVYAASKAGLLGLTRYLSAYWADKGVRVNAVTPGGIFSGQNDTFVSRYSARVPMGRMAEQDEMSGAVIYLASDASSYVTGHNLVVDGGLTAW